MSALKGQVSTNLDEIVQMTDPPFIEQVTSFPLSTKFKMPQVEAYDGLRNPLDHLESFKTLMHLQGFLDEIMCRVFPTTLKGPTRVWFSKLTLNIVSTFKELNWHFVTHFIKGKRHRRSSAAILSITQREDERLRSYVTRFNKKALIINETDDKVLVTAFTCELVPREFPFSLYKNDPKTMVETLYKATKYMNAEDAMIARGTSQWRDKDKTTIVRTKEGSCLEQMSEGMKGDQNPRKEGRQISPPWIAC